MLSFLVANFCIIVKYFCLHKTDKPLESLSGKGESAGKQHSLHFPKCTFQRQMQSFDPYVNCSLKIL